MLALVEDKHLLRRNVKALERLACGPVSELYFQLVFPVSVGNHAHLSPPDILPGYIHEQSHNVPLLGLGSWPSRGRRAAVLKCHSRCSSCSGGGGAGAGRLDSGRVPRLTRRGLIRKFSADGDPHLVYRFVERVLRSSVLEVRARSTCSRYETAQLEFSVLSSCECPGQTTLLCDIQLRKNVPMNVRIDIAVQGKSARTK